MALRGIGGPASSTEVSARAGVTRQTARRHLSSLTKEGRILKTGGARATRYSFAPLELELDPSGLEEDRVWSGEVAPWVTKLGGVTKEARGRAHHCVTELLNNAIDHAGGTRIQLRAALEEGLLSFVIEDDGVGAYERLVRDFGFETHRAAIQALQAGKLTSDPVNHAGEGIFFSSKMTVQFLLESSELSWTVDNVAQEAWVGPSTLTNGTRVSFTIDPESAEPASRVFDLYTGDDFGFSKTRIVVRLYDYGEELRARSAAKRLATSIEGFSEVVLDFKGVEELGQGFADQLFVVFVRAHPETTLIPRNASRDVEAMIRYVRRRLP